MLDLFPGSASSTSSTTNVASLVRAALPPPNARLSGKVCCQLLDLFIHPPSTLSAMARRLPFGGRWTGDTVLRYRFNNLFASASHKLLSVRKWLTRYIPSRFLGFGNNLSPESQHELTQLNNLVRSINLTASPDMLLWRWSDKGIFTTGSAYRFLSFGGVVDRKIGRLWNIKIPLRVRIFL